MVAKKRKIPVFIASPGDLNDERQCFKELLEELNAAWADGADVEFEAIGWEDTMPSVGRRNQDLINKEVDRCEVFVLLFYRRWGQGNPGLNQYTSYTEEEFFRALERFKETKSPEIFVYFKRVDSGQEVDPGPQLIKILAFRKQLEDSRCVLFKTFGETEEFKNSLSKYLKFYAKGGAVDIGKEIALDIIPSGALDELIEDGRIKQTEIEKLDYNKDALERAWKEVEKLNLEKAEDAANLALKGQVVHAREKFLDLVYGSENLRILFLCFEFFLRTGDLELAEKAAQKSLDLDTNKTWTAEI